MSQQTFPGTFTRRRSAGFISGPDPLGHLPLIRDDTPQSQARGQVLVAGGGAAGLSIASRLRRALPDAQISLIDPAAEHYYQPSLLQASSLRLRYGSRSVILFGMEFTGSRTRSLVSIPITTPLKPQTAAGTYDILVLAPGLHLRGAAQRLYPGLSLLNVGCLCHDESSGICTS
jgi:hypothetical protein